MENMRECNKRIYSESLEDAREILRDGRFPAMVVPSNLISVAYLPCW